MAVDLMPDVREHVFYLLQADVACSPLPYDRIDLDSNS